MAVNGLKNQGFVQLLALSMLAILSLSLLGVTLTNTVKLRQSTQRHIAYLKMRWDASNVLNTTKLHYLSSGEKPALTLSRENYGIQVSSTENQLTQSNLNDKSVIVELTTLNKKQHTVTYSETLTFHNILFLINKPDSAISTWSKPELEKFSQQYFGRTLQQLLALKPHSRYTHTSCSKINNTVTGIIWIEGDCDVVQTQIGSVQRPVLLIIEDGILNVRQSEIFGLVIHLCRDNKESLEAYFDGTHISGAFITSCDQSVSNAVVSYDNTLLEAFKNHWDNRIVKEVEGSWHRN